MTRLMLLLGGALVAVAILAYATWQWLEPQLYGPTPPVTAENVFQSINPEREFVDDLARRVLATPPFRAAMQVTAGDAVALDLSTHSDVLIVLAAAHRISPIPVLNDALTAASNYFMARYYDLGRREWRHDMVADGTPGAPTLSDISRAIRALAMAYDVTGNQRQLQAARSAWTLHRSFVLPAAALPDQTSLRTLPIDSASLVAAFDALSVLYEVSGGGGLLADMEVMARYIGRDLLDRSGGVLATAYAPTLEPLAGPPLAAAEQLTLASALALATGQGLSSLFVAPGSDLLDAMIMEKSSSAKAGYTPSDHIEAARAIAIYATMKDRRDLWPAFAYHYNALRADLTPASPPDVLARAARFYLQYNRLSIPER